MGVADRLSLLRCRRSVAMYTNLHYRRRPSDAKVAEAARSSGELGWPVSCGQGKERGAVAKDKLNVLLLAGYFEVRGSCAYTLRLLEHLDDHAVLARMVCISGDRVPESKRQTLPIDVRPYLGIPILNRVAVWDLARSLDGSSINLVHVQTRTVAKLGIWLARSLDVPYLLTVHDFLGPREHLPIDRRRCRGIICVSEAVRDSLAERMAELAPLLTVILSGVELPPSPPRPDPQGRLPVIGTAGPLERVKGQRYFLEAARRMLEEGHDAEFMIAGSGEEEASLRQLARDLGIADKVTFATHMREFSEVMGAIDIFVLPSLQQGLGSIMLEAMAWARPVIATRVGGVESIVEHRKTGLLVPGGDSAALADAILYLLDHWDEAEQIGTQARKMVAEYYRVDQMVERTAQLYRQAVKQPVEQKQQAG